MFAGSAVANGSGSGIVTATGMATEIGKIQSDIQVGLGCVGGRGFVCVSRGEVRCMNDVWSSTLD
jgi:hypothetical protein